MEDIRIETNYPCNYCFDFKPTEGLTWKREDSHEYYHVCNKCADVFRKRKEGEINRRLRAGMQPGGRLTEEEKYLRQEIRCLGNRGLMYSVDIEKYVINAFTNEEEEYLSAYGSVVRSRKIAERQRKWKYTFAKKRLADEWFTETMSTTGWYDTKYNGCLEVEEIMELGKWNNEEKAQIEQLVSKHKEYRRQKDKDFEEFLRMEDEKKAEEMISKID